MNVKTPTVALMASASTLKDLTAVSVHTQWFWIPQKSDASDRQSLVVCLIACIASEEVQEQAKTTINQD